MTINGNGVALCISISLLLTLPVMLVTKFLVPSSTVNVGGSSVVCSLTVVVVVVVVVAVVVVG